MDGNEQHEVAVMRPMEAQPPSDRMRPINELAKALAVAQSGYDEVFKAQTADAGKYEYSYADLSDVLRAVRGPLSKVGLCLTQLMRPYDDGMAVETLLIHESGQYLRSLFPVSNKGGIQALGSNITYARRYSALGILGIHPTKDDDDGAAGDGRRGNDNDRERDHSYRPERYREEDRRRSDDRGPPRDDRGPRDDDRGPSRDDRGPPADDRRGSGLSWQDEAKRIAARIREAVSLHELDDIQDGDAMAALKKNADNTTWNFVVGRLEDKRKALEAEQKRAAA